jgi:hypothetical protein
MVMGGGSVLRVSRLCRGAEPFNGMGGIIVVESN